MDANEMIRRRLVNQRVAPPGCKTPAQAVRALGALQAQDYAGSLWSVGLRTPGATKASVERAIAKGEIVRTWPLRGTLHLAAAADVRWMLALTAARTIARTARRRAQLEIDEPTLARCAKIFSAALGGGKRLTRDRVLELLETRSISTKGQRGYHILFNLALKGLLCFGPEDGGRQSFVLLDEWVPAQPEIVREEALGRLVSSYFGGHGPATVQDCAWWAGLTVSDIRVGLDSAGDRLVSKDVDGAAYWMPRGEPRAGTEDQAYLLPGFDEYVLGYKDRSLVLDARHAQTIAPGGNGIFKPALVIEGHVAGTWGRARGGRASDVELHAFAAMNRSQQRAAEAAIERYAAFLGEV